MDHISPSADDQTEEAHRYNVLYSQERIYAPTQTSPPASEHSMTQVHAIFVDIMNY
ncbi:hypothetical protein [Arcanobacterium buesumense]|uniref:hypothetical protein n=1 Tax=Arcanobacterium buesumense TaxID=2722751 RepID=UPI001B3AAA89|nr:hypothetical protein [Arcanobacterium buesumense]